MTLFRALLAATLAALAQADASACAQDAVVIHPGSREVDGSRVAARTDTFAVMMLRGGREIPVASLELRTARVTAPGAPAVSRTERMTLLGGRGVSVDFHTPGLQAFAFRRIASASRRS